MKLASILIKKFYQFDGTLVSSISSEAAPAFTGEKKKLETSSSIIESAIIK
jgi:hypothetical protein